jgi:hypothetical protein
MIFIICWAFMIVCFAFIAAAFSLQALSGFIAGVITVLAASLAVGFAAASTYGRDDEWEP